ncbi:MAG: alanine racemase [Candidatus Omnitrophota bacterium]|nr:alanine racemase [Candidatus Omnitrophota bacterium]
MNYKGYRPTWAEVNLGNLAYNFSQIKKLLKSGIKVMATVKADAYGHGLIPVAKKLVSCGVDFFGVASLDEGISLRQAGIKEPILIMGLILKKDIQPVFKYKLIPTLCEEGIALALNKKARLLKMPVKVHIKVDTGMGRIGVLYKDAERFIKKIHKLKFINIEGVFTHFPFADIDKEFTLNQVNLFGDLISRLKACGINIPLCHAANSMGIISCGMSHFNMVRPGLAIYGLYPLSIGGRRINLKPVLSLKTKVIFTKKVPAGFGISYSHTYVTKKKSTIVTLPIGYGDGYPRNLSNQAPVLIKGRRFKICGNISMDQTMVDVGDLAIKTEDEVVLIGSQGRNRITAEELAGLAGTISYEIVCGLGSRIPRLYRQ